MATGARSNKDKAMASFMKSKGIVRRSGACPWGCGHLVANGGTPLLLHLNNCKGSSKKSR